MNPLSFSISLCVCIILSATFISICKGQASPDSSSGSEFNPNCSQFSIIHHDLHCDRVGRFPLKDNCTFYYECVHSESQLAYQLSLKRCADELRFDGLECIEIGNGTDECPTMLCPYALGDFKNIPFIPNEQEAQDHNDQSHPEQEVEANSTTTDDVSAATEEINFLNQTQDLGVRAKIKPAEEVTAALSNITSHGIHHTKGNWSEINVDPSSELSDDNNNDDGNMNITDADESISAGYPVTIITNIYEEEHNIDNNEVPNDIHVPENISGEETERKDSHDPEDLVEPRNSHNPNTTASTSSNSTSTSALVSSSTLAVMICICCIQRFM